jgi:hypothetical protein
MPIDRHLVLPLDGRLPDAAIYACVDEYRRTYERLREYERARELGGPVDAPAHLAAADAVLLARAALYRCLMDHGWVPPAAVLADLRLDEAVARESTGAAGG